MRRRLGAGASIPSVVLASALLLGACTSKNATGTAQVPTAPPSSPTASPSPSPSPLDSPSPSISPSPSVSASPAALEDGRHFGFIQSVDAGTLAMVFDLSEFLTGDEANQAAIEDGVIQEGESVPNDYYIRNRNPKLRSLVLSPELQIILVSWMNCCETTVNGVLADFAASFTTPDDVYHGAQSSYWLTVEAGVVTKIEEQYLP